MPKRKVGKWKDEYVVQFVVGADWRSGFSPNRYLVGNAHHSLVVDASTELQSKMKYSAQLKSMKLKKLKYKVDDIEEQERKETLVLESCGVLVLSSESSGSFIAVVRNINTEAGRNFKFAMDEKEDQKFEEQFSNFKCMCKAELEMLSNENHQSQFWEEGIHRRFDRLKGRLDKYGSKITDFARNALSNEDIPETPPFSLPKGNFSSWNEQKIETAKRELKEETGLKIDSFRGDVALLRVNSKYENLFWLFYIAKEPIKKKELKSEISTDKPAWKAQEELEKQPFFAEARWKTIRSTDGNLDDAIKDFASTQQGTLLVPFPWNEFQNNFTINSE